MAFGERLPFSVEFLKTNYMFGLDLTNDQGEEYPDSMFEFYIMAGLRWVERQIDIPLAPKVVTDERHDYIVKDYRQWVWLNLNEKPIISVESVKLEYPIGVSAFTFPADWVTFSKSTPSSRIQIVPKTGALSQILITKAGNLFPMLQATVDYIPDAFTVNYTAGFPDGEIPEDIVHLMAMFATIGPLNIAGDLLGGAGIASKSVSIPGIHQSFNTTSSATSAGYGSRILEYQKEIKQQLPLVKAYYGRSTQLVVV
jgi:hypothetical protein